MATKIQRVRFNLPKELRPDERKEVGELIAEKIRKNAESGKGRQFDNKGMRDGIVKEYVKFPKYSKSYVNSLDFKVSGKSPSSIDLTLSGDMLQSLDVINTKSGEVVLGFPEDQNGKADGNIRGTYGKDSADKSKARNFLGLTQSDYNKIVNKYLKDREGES
jgi:hypothetical protein